MKVNWNDSEMDIEGFDAGGGEIYYYQGKPFTGVLEETSNGILICEIECKNGYPEGLQRHFHNNGQLREESFIKFNNPFGIMREWDENGNLLSEYDWGPEP